MLTFFSGEGAAADIKLANKWCNCQGWGLKTNQFLFGFLYSNTLLFRLTEFINTLATLLANKF